MTFPNILFLIILIGGVSFLGSRLFNPVAEVAQIDISIPELSAVAQQGKTLFDANCARCHGNNAAGGNAGPPLVHKIYEPNHHADVAFVLATKRGVRAHHWQFGNMPALPDLVEPDVAQIVAYVRELQRANGIF